MTFEEISRRGLALLGCGKMGQAMLDGWLKAGLAPGAVHVLDPMPSDRLRALAGDGLHLNRALPDQVGLCLLAVKPQFMATALPQVTHLGGGGTLILSIAAGTPLAAFEHAFGAATPIVRAMPNTPAAIGRGITALVGNDNATQAHLATAETVLGVIGQTVRLESEAQIDAVTGLSGSGPAYVFHLIECLTAAGVAEGLPEPMASQLAVATVAGAGALAQESGVPAEQLRRDVTSPNGTTQAGLEVLMDAEAGMPPLINKTVAAAAARSRALARSS